ncbi:MAG TPA: hypothetical protein VJ886_04560 [Roseovarius sp.]|nr:hypothetical protein [Roseovarius sp.]
MVDVVGGLTAAKPALGLAKDLREIDKSIDEATYKMKLAELMSALAETQTTLAEANTLISELQGEIDVLSNGEVCPKCHNGRLQLNRTESNHHFGASHFGVEWHFYDCGNGNCDYSERRLHDPAGVMKELAKKR